MDSTGSPARRATKACASSWSTSDKKKSALVASAVVHRTEPVHSGCVTANRPATENVSTAAIRIHV
jgi:hypothetical protein